MKGWVLPVKHANSAQSFFTAINHFSRPLRKHEFTSMASKGHIHGLLLVDFDPFCFFLFFRVRWLS